ncbi:conserved protein of unknown function [Tenacibaculum sp. 190130A14a]|uniref:Uncharacterized protein n=1 Tax=Tenacibaculum polynesiense TaxID=3137857 RepID=A0ABM9PA98_9FLAO
MKKIVVTLIFFWLSCANSQEKIGEFYLEENGSKYHIKKSFSIFNNYNNSIATFLLEKKTIHAHLLNKNFDYQKDLALQDIKKKYSVLVSKLYNKQNNYTLILSNKEKDKFAMVKFDFKSNKVEFIEDVLKVKKLIFLQSVNKGDTSHLLFLDEKTSNIISKNFTFTNKTTTTVFHLEKEEFLINAERKISLKKLLADYKKANHREVKNIEYELTKINENPYKTQIVENTFFEGAAYSTERTQLSPTSMELTSRFNKLYIKNNDVILTLDKNRFYTQILTLNLANGSYTFEKVKKPLFEEQHMYKRSNSFIYNNNLFLVTASKNKLICAIHNLKNKQKIKRIEANINEPINFKNSSIVQEGGAFKNNRNFEETNKFLRKISESNIGIGVIKHHNTYEVVIGAQKQAMKGSSTALIFFQMGLMGFSPNILNIESFSSPNSTSFFNYLTTKSIKIHCLFDENFNHKEGVVKRNVYDEIADFVKSTKDKNTDGIYHNYDNDFKKPKAINIFKIENKTVLGAYLPKTKKYTFYKFD